MSKFKVSTNKALGTIKVVTLITLRVTPLDERYLLPFPFPDEVNGYVPFITDLPNNLTLEQYM